MIAAEPLEYAATPADAFLVEVFEDLTLGGEPSMDVVPGLADLLDDLVGLYKRYVAFMEPSHPDALALWTMYSHAFGKNQPYSVVPYVLITSAEPMSGKSTVLELAAKLVRNPMNAQDVTPAFVGRTCGEKTLLLDEIDGVYSGHDREEESRAGQLRTILNAGFNRTGKYQRLVPGGRGKDFAPQEWSIFGPKMLAGIGRNVPDTVQTRSIRIRMARKTNDSPTERPRDRYIARDAAPLAERMEAMAETVGTLHYVDDLPDAMSHRDQDLWEPLFALAARAGGTWPDRTRAAAIELARSEPVLSLGMQLLADIRTIFESQDYPIHIASADLIGRPVDSRYFSFTATGLCALETSPWATLTRGQPITPHRMAKLLSEYDIAPGRTHVGRDSYGPQGYFRASFESAWRRYLPGTVEQVAEAGSADAGTTTAAAPAAAQSTLNLG